MPTIVVVEKTSIGYYVFFAMGRSLWFTESTLSGVIASCKRLNALIAYVEEDKQIMQTDNCVWEPELSREEVFNILKTHEDYVSFLCQSKDPVIPKNLEQLAECLVHFGGQVMMIESIKKEIESGQEYLSYKNYGGFSIKFSAELAKQYIATR